MRCAVRFRTTAFLGISERRGVMRDTPDDITTGQILNQVTGFDVTKSKWVGSKFGITCPTESVESLLECHCMCLGGRGWGKRRDKSHKFIDHLRYLGSYTWFAVKSGNQKMPQMAAGHHEVTITGRFTEDVVQNTFPGQPTASGVKGTN